MKQLNHTNAKALLLQAIDPALSGYPVEITGKEQASVVAMR